MTEFILNTIENSGYLGVALLMLLENLFPPLPSELILPLAGYLTTQGELSFLGMLGAAMAGSVAGALPWYYLGVWLDEGRVVHLADRYGRWLTVTPKDVVRAFAWFRKYKGAAVFFGRMVPTVRTLISVPAGSVRMPLLRFLLLTALGSAIWISLLGAAGLWLGANYEQVGHYISPVGNAIVAAVVVLYLYRLLTFRRHQSRG